ncbi:MAG: Gldg family protein [Promethearchaeota archaeon]
MEKITEKTICFDYSHNNKLIIESSSYSDFTQFLFASGFKIGQIKQGITAQKLKQYDIFIIGNPFGKLFEVEEISAIESYVRNGGGLLIISDGGGDHENETNLSEITEKFGFKFNPDFVCDSMNYSRKQEIPIINKLEPHPITREVQQFIHSSGCSLSVDEKTYNSDKNINMHILARGGLNTFIKTYDGENIIENDAPNCPILIAEKCYEGRVVGLGNSSIFSSLSSYYGFNTLNNSMLIGNILNWLALAGEQDLEELGYEKKLISIPINYSLFLWMEKLVHGKKWNNFTDIINFSIKNFKDNYKRVIEEATERRKQLTQIRRKISIEKKNKMKQRDLERSEALQDTEDLILNLADERKKGRDEKDAETLDNIIEDLSKIDKDDR